MCHSDAAAANEEDESTQLGSATLSNASTHEPTSESKPSVGEPQPRTLQHSFELDDTAVGMEPHSRPGGAGSTRSTVSHTRSVTGSALRDRFGGMAKHTIGLVLLLGVVFLWTLSNFLGSSIFADASYAKPFFLTYLNTSIFLFAMIPTMIRWTFRQQRNGTLRSELRRIFSMHTIKLFFGSGDRSSSTDVAAKLDDDDSEESEAFIKANTQTAISMHASVVSHAPADFIKEDAVYLDSISTARLSLAFCILWFGANYFAMSCLQYTTVASATILTSTSSIWTLLIGALTRTEKFTWRKLCGVLASLAGIVLISRVDLSRPSKSSSTPSDPTSLGIRAIDVFPDKPAKELALGDGLALFSAIIYGFYTITLKRSTIKAAPLELHMPTFFGLVGLFNIFLLLPLFPLLHFTGIEPLQLPPTGQIWTVLIVNSISSFASDIMWAYAMVFTSPLLVTVGLSLTIPLSLVGEMIVQARYEGWMYWIGAMVVVGSFVFVDREEVREEEGEEEEEQDEMRDVEDGFASVSASMNLHSSVGSSGADRSYLAHPTDGDDDLAGLMGSDDEDDGARDRLQQQIDGNFA